MDDCLIKLDETERPFRSWYGLYCELDTDSPMTEIVINKMIASADNLVDYACISRTKLNPIQQQKVLLRIETICKDNIRLWVEVASYVEAGKFVIDRTIEVIEYADSVAFLSSLDSLNEIDFWPVQPRVAKAWILRACNWVKTTEGVLDLYLQQRRHCPSDGSSVWAAGMINNFCSKDNDQKFNELLNIRDKIRDGSDPLRKRITSLILEMPLTKEQWQKI